MGNVFGSTWKFSTDRPIILSCKFDDVVTEEKFQRWAWIIGGIILALGATLMFVLVPLATLGALIARLGYLPSIAGSWLWIVLLIIAVILLIILLSTFIIVGIVGISLTALGPLLVGILRWVGRCRKKARRPNTNSIFKQIQKVKGVSAESEAQGFRGGVYYPNRYPKQHNCNPKHNPLCTPDDPSCHGDEDRCAFTEAKGFVGIKQCWRASYVKHLLAIQKQGGILLQIIDDGHLGHGQQEEVAWAKACGIEIWHCFDDITKAQPGPWQDKKSQ